jgi:hypothetical protein
VTPPALPPLPVTWRPRKARVVSLAVAATVMAVVIVVAAILPSGGARPWPLLDRLGLVAIGALVAGFLWRQSAVHITADERGLRVVNLFRSRRLEWAEVVAVTLHDGDPWLMLDLSDGETLPVMGIQSTDGARARQAGRELRALVAARTTTERND